MKDGSPVTEGSLVFKATGPEQVEVRMEKPTRTGIFIPSVTFPKPGTYQAKMIVESPQVEGGGETIELPPVVVYANSDEALAAAKEAPEENAADAISFLKEQQWRVGLITTAAETTRTRRAIGCAGPRDCAARIGGHRRFADHRQGRAARGQRFPQGRRQGGKRASAGLHRAFRGRCRGRAVGRQSSPVADARRRSGRQTTGDRNQDSQRGIGLEAGARTRWNARRS